MKYRTLLMKLLCGTLWNLCGTLCYKNITRRPTEKIQRNTEKSLQEKSMI